LYSRINDEENLNQLGD
jgi:hypothetical protein